MECSEYILVVVSCEACEMPKVKEKGKEQSLLANEGKLGRRNAPIKEESKTKKLTGYQRMNFTALAIIYYIK